MNQNLCPVCHSPSADVLNGICAGCLWADCMDGSDLVPGHILGEEIARGGMGIVYAARQISPDRAVAVKMLRHHLVEQPSMLERFRQEARAAAALQHPGILPVYQVGETDEAPWFTMMLAAGGTLAARREKYAGQWREIAKLVAHLARAVAHAHERGVLHRDLKPGNILFDSAGRAYVCDFGLAKLAFDEEDEADLTLSLQFLGTPHYMAPEIASGSMKAATTSADTYALGVILYELLSGHPPFRAESVPALMRKIADEEPAVIGAIRSAENPPRDLAAVAARCLEKSPARRYATCGALADDLEAWLDGRPVTARHLGRLQLLGRWVRRNPLVAVLTGLLAAALAAGALLITASNHRLSAALGEARSRLHGSLVSEARMRLGVPAGARRTEVLALLDRAAAAGPVTGEMSELAAAAFTAPDLTPLHQWEVPEGVTVAFSPRMDWWIGVGSREDGVQVRSCTDGAEVRHFPGPPGETCVSAVWADSADRVILIFSNKSGAVWHMKQPEPLCVWPPGEAPDQVSCSAACNRLALCRRGRGAEIVYLPPRQPGTTALPGTEDADFAVISPDGQSVLIGRPGQLSCLSVRADAGRPGSLLWEVQRSDTLHSCVWTGDSSGFTAIRNNAGAIGLYDANDGGINENFDSKHLYGESLHLAPDGMSGVSVTAGGLLRLWDQRDGQELLRVSGAPAPARLSLDGSRLGWMPDRTHAAVSMAGSAVFREHGAVRQRQPGHLGIFRISDDGAVLAACGKRTVAAWRTEVDGPPAIARLDLNGAERTEDLQCDTPRQRIVVGMPGKIAEFSVSAEAISKAVKDNLWQPDISPASAEGEFHALTDHGNSLVFASPRAVTVWPRGNENRQRTIPVEPGARFACFSGCGRWCVSISADKKELIVTGTPQDGIAGGPLRLPVRDAQSARFSPDSKWLLVKTPAGWQIWSTASWNPGPDFPSVSPLHTEATGCFSTDGSILLLRTESDRISLFHLPSGRLRLRLPFPGGQHVFSFQFDGARQLLWVMAGNGRLYRWDVGALEKELTARGYMPPDGG